MLNNKLSIAWHIEVAWLLKKSGKVSHYLTLEMKFCQSKSGCIQESQFGVMVKGTKLEKGDQEF